MANRHCPRPICIVTHSVNRHNVSFSPHNAGRYDMSTVNWVFVVFVRPRPPKTIVFPRLYGYYVFTRTCWRNDKHIFTFWLTDFDSVYVSVLNAFEIVECSYKNIAKKKTFQTWKTYLFGRKTMFYTEMILRNLLILQIYVLYIVKRSTKNFKITIVLCLPTDYLCRFW